MAAESSFGATLERYISRAGCTAAHLAQSSGVSEAALSRYRNGSRVPSPDSDIIASLATALGQLSVNQPQPIDTGEAPSRLTACAAAQKPRVSAEFAQRFDALCTASGVKGADLAAATNFDTSFLSRVKSGQRKPADMDLFCRRVAQCVAESLRPDQRVDLLEQLAGVTLAADHGPDQAAQALAFWLQSSDAPLRPAETPIKSFLEHLDAFDLNDYLAEIHFDSIKVPTTPFTLPGSKDYYQLEGMRQAEIDFLRVTATSKASKRVVMCSDMPMEDMAEDPDFAKKWMLGLGALMKRGVCLTMIHNVNRPMSELMLGLESWIPLYMTGLVEPYYLKNVAPGPYQHLDYVSDVAALHGECIAGFHAQGRYRLEKGQKEIAYQQQRLQALLSCASPLMRIFGEDDQEDFALFMGKEGDGVQEVDSSAFKNIALKVKPGVWALVEKSNAPVMRFVIHHPRLVSALEQFAAPYGQHGFKGETLT